MSEDKRQVLADLLRAVADRTTSVDEVLGLVEQWEGVPRESRVFDDANHALQHFKIDEDIRLRDPEYARQHREGLRKIAARLKTA